MTALTPHARAATPPAARGSAAPDADPAGAPHPPHGAPAQSSASSTPLPGDAGSSSPQAAVHGAETVPGPEIARPGIAAVRAGAPAPVAAVPDGSRLSGPAAATGKRSGSDKRQRQKGVHVRLSDEEHALLEAVADRLDASPASVLRRSFLAMYDGPAAGTARKPG